MTAMWRPRPRLSAHQKKPGPGASKLLPHSPKETQPSPKSPRGRAACGSWALAEQGPSFPWRHRGEMGTRRGRLLPGRLEARFRCGTRGAARRKSSLRRGRHVRTAGGAVLEAGSCLLIGYCEWIAWAAGVGWRRVAGLEGKVLHPAGHWDRGGHPRRGSDGAVSTGGCVASAWPGSQEPLTFCPFLSFLRFPSLVFT